MEVAITGQGNPTTIAVTGAIDTTTASEFQDFALKVIDGGVDNLVVDLAGCTYIASSGLRALVVLQKRLIDGRLTFIHVSPEIQDIFYMTGFDHILTFS